jgi:hypothetical protein
LPIFSRGQGDLVFLASLPRDVRNKSITKVYDDVAIWHLRSFFQFLFSIPFSYFFLNFLSPSFSFSVPPFSYSSFYYELHYDEKMPRVSVLSVAVLLQKTASAQPPSRPGLTHAIQQLLKQAGAMYLELHCGSSNILGPIPLLRVGPRSRPALRYRNVR